MCIGCGRSESEEGAGKLGLSSDLRGKARAPVLGRALGQVLRAAPQQKRRASTRQAVAAGHAVHRGHAPLAKLGDSGSRVGLCGTRNSDTDAILL